MFTQESISKQQLISAIYKHCVFCNNQHIERIEMCDCNTCPLHSFRMLGVPEDIPIVKPTRVVKTIDTPKVEESFIKKRRKNAVKD